MSVRIYGPDTEYGLLPIQPASAFRQELDVNRSFYALSLVKGIGHAHIGVFVVIFDVRFRQIVDEVVLHRVAELDILVEHILRFAVEHPVRVGTKRCNARIEIVGHDQPAGKSVLAALYLDACTDLLRFEAPPQIDIFLVHGRNELHIQIVAGRKFSQLGGIAQIALEPDRIAHIVNLAVCMEVHFFRRKELCIVGKAILALPGKRRQSEEKP